MTKEEHILSTLAAPPHFTSSSVGKLLCLNMDWKSDSTKNRLAVKICQNVTKLQISEILNFTCVWGLRSDIQCFGKLGAAHQVLLVPPPQWPMMFQPLAALGMWLANAHDMLRKHHPAWGYSVSQYLGFLSIEGCCNTKNSIILSSKRK